MDRREALKTTSFVIGYSLSASAIAVVLEGCRTEPKAQGVTEEMWKPVFFDQLQVELVAELAETLIPETTTPGAKSVRVHEFIDDRIQNCYDPQDQYRFVRGLEDVEVRSSAVFGKVFEDCSMDERMELLKILEEETKQEKESRNSIGESFYSMLRSMTLEGYFTSEKIGTEILKFDPVPGVYQGCIPYADVGKLWSI
jgi:hypothetical protein